MKKYLVFILIAFIIGGAKVNASPIDDECINSETCVVLCNYKTTVRGGSSNEKWYRNITLYYFFDKGLYIKYESPTGKDAFVSDKGPYPSFSYALSKEGGVNAYWGLNYTPSVSEFSCPTNGYLDTDGFNGGNELCFDDDGKTCKETYSNFATSFGFGHNYISQEKDYDFEEQILHYKDWIFGDIKEQISNGKFNVEEEIYEKVKKDFQANFLYGNTVPAFIANSEAYQSIYDSVSEEFEKAKKEETEKAEQDLEDGKITQEEHDNIVYNWNNIDSEKVEEQAQQALEDIKTDSIKNSLNWEANTCDSLLGSTTNSSEPAYYLNFAFNLMKYAAIVILFALTIVDFAKAAASSDNDALKKALQKTIKRIIICIIIFFLPTLINFILSLLGVVDNPTCGIGVN